MPEFEKQWKKLCLNDDDLLSLQEFLCLKPDLGQIITGTGGLRKLLWALPGKGKRGNIRVIYIDFIFYEKLYLITAYKKSQKVNLKKDEKNKVKRLIKQLLDEIRRNQDG